MKQLNVGSLLLGLGAALAGACGTHADSSTSVAHADSLLAQGRTGDAIADYRRVLKSEPDNSHANRQVGLAYLQAGELTRAYNFLLRARSLSPNDAQTRFSLGRIYLIQNQPNEVREQAMAMLASDSANTSALVLLGSVASNAADAAALIKKLEAEKARSVDQPQAHFALATLYMRRHDTATAEAILQDIARGATPSAAAHSVMATFYASRGDRPRADEESKAASDLAPVGSAARLDLATLHLLLGNRGQAERILQETVEKAPDDVASRRLLTTLALADGLPSKAAPWIASAMSKDSADLETLVQRGRQRLAMRQAVDAMQDFRAALRVDSVLAPIHFQMGLADIQTANSSQEKAAVDSATIRAEQEFETANRLAPGFPEAVLQLADLRIQAGVPKRAIGDLDHYIRENPNSVRAYSILGAALLATRRIPECVETYRNMIGIAPNNAEAHYRLGLALLAQGQKDEASDEFESAVSLRPGYADPMSQLVLAEVTEGRAEAALARLQKEIEVAPQSAPLYDLLALVRMARNEQDLAEAAFTKAIELDPGLVDARVRLAEVYNVSGRFDQAVAQAEPAVTLEPRNLRAIMALAAAYQQKQDVPRARRLYETALRINPRHLDAANNLAVLLSDQPGSGEDALRYARLAADIAPNDPHVSDTLGWILYRRREYGRAYDLIKESAAKLPESSSIQYHLGIAAQHMGDTATAREALTKAVGSAFPFAGKEEARKALQAMR